MVNDHPTVSQGEMDTLSDHIETLFAANGVSFADQQIIAAATKAHVLSEFAENIALHAEDFVRAHPDATDFQKISVGAGMALAEDALREAHISAASALEVLYFGNFTALDED